MTWAADTGVQPNGCDCDNCRNGDLPGNPFLAPRVTRGMLLGEDDFATVIGYPRGKHMLHQAWLHGSGVVWGYPVIATGLWELEVGPGLAISRIGQDLILTARRKLDLRELVKSAIKDGKLDLPGEEEELAKSQPGGNQYEANRLAEAEKPEYASKSEHGTTSQTTIMPACVVAEFEGCRTAPVPVVADPCDVNRTHDDYSRVIEQARISVRFGKCPQPRTGHYHRVQVLLGLEPVGDKDEPGQQALEAREAVLKAKDPASELEHQLWEMACRDGIDLHPVHEDEYAYGWFPSATEDAAVVLAEIDIPLRNRNGDWQFEKQPEVRECVRSTLLPTDVITSLTAGLAPGLVRPTMGMSQGPQVYSQKLHLEDDRQKLIMPVTASLVPGTVPGSIEITTLAGDRDSWVTQNIVDAYYDETDQAIVIRLDRSLNEWPATALVRVCVRGTGCKPVMGVSPLLPLAGVYGQTPGDAQEGQDAVWTFNNDFGRTSGYGQPTQAAPAYESESTVEEAVE